MRVTQISNGATVATRREGAGPHTLVVAGQHGSETGPILGIAGWEPSWCNVTVISCANPLGFALNWRYTELLDGSTRPTREIDMNRQWGTDGTIASELWVAVLEHLGGRVPDRVIDLHSSPSHTRGRVSLGHLVITANEASRSSLALPIVDVLRTVEPEWSAWSPEKPVGTIEISPDDFRGTLVDHASRLGAAAVTVEFADDFGTEVPISAAPSEAVACFSNVPVRRRSLQERMLGVHTLLSWIESTSRG